MPRLFGKDIAGIIGRALAKNLLPATLVKVTPGSRTPGNLAAGNNPTTTEHSCRGVILDFAAGQVDGTIVKSGDRKVLLLGSTILPAAVPDAGDRILIEDEELNVVSVRRDPAAASYECQVRA